MKKIDLNILVVQVRVNALLCLAELVQTLDKPAIIEILQTVQRCTAVDRSAPTLMCTLAIANAILKQVGNRLNFHLHISILNVLTSLSSIFCSITLSLSLF